MRSLVLGGENGVQQLKMGSGTEQRFSSELMAAGLVDAELVERARVKA